MPDDPSLALKDLSDWADEVEVRFQVANESGLFCNDEASAKSILGHLRNARKCVTDQDRPAAAECLGLAEVDLQTSFSRKGCLWRTAHLHQLPIYSFHVLMLTAVLFLGTDLVGANKSSIWQIPASVLAFGAVGASLRGLWWLHLKVTEQRYRPQFLVAHLSAPWIGSVLGIIAYLLVRTGKLLLDPAETEMIGTTAAPSADFITGAAVLYAGYSWEWILTKLESALGGKSQP